MKTIPLIIMVIILFLTCGCDEMSLDTHTLPDNSCDIFYNYTQTDIRVIGLTEIAVIRQHPPAAIIKAYVELLDSAGSRIKSPGVFRFELYHFKPRSSKPKGKRIFAWGEIDLTKAAENNSYWQDHLDAYRFDLELDFAPPQNQTYILEIHCLTPTNKRLIKLYQLKYNK